MKGLTRSRGEDRRVDRGTLLQSVCFSGYHRLACEFHVSVRCPAATASLVHDCPGGYAYFLLPATTVSLHAASGASGITLV